ncbi:MAG: UDP-2,3-diacylglucosamine diphosphatase [Gammaproteobacteria bacterium]|nr:UDP-2,3-diacylglucosamine diphosphatase [Gammaproteobacteria bacterium]
MSKTIFIADLHLDKQYPKAVSAFQRYFVGLKGQSIDAVYILGDLFEYWLGDDCVDKTSQLIADTLNDYQQKTDVPVYFIHGNRDFLLGDEYAQRCGMKILPELVEIDLYGVKTLVLHGDTLCTDDLDYQHFREKVRSSDWQEKILKLPAWVRRLKALQMRRKSKKSNANKSDMIMDVAQLSVEKTMRQYSVSQIIHGHTHRPAIHEFDLDGTIAKRYVVGDWYTQGSALEVSEDSYELITMDL